MHLERSPVCRLDSINPTMRLKPTLLKPTHRRSRLNSAISLICCAWLPTAVLGQNLQSVVITGAPPADTALDASQPVSVISGQTLDRRRAISLGDTVDGMPGVHSTGFGVAAGRPVIRGQSGPRVSVLENGLDMLDASSLSPDHAVASDPLSLRRVEVLRGPATLLYGSGAIGGVANAVSEWIPTTATRKLNGEALLAGDSASRGGLGSVRLGGSAGGDGRLNWSLGGFARDAGDYAIPGFAVRGDPTSASGRLPNSFAQGHGLSGGVSWIDRWGVVGISTSSLDTRYGIPSEEGVYIDLNNRRTEALLELSEPMQGIESFRLRGADVRYRHQEIEAAEGVVGTAFSSKGQDVRMEALHTPWGALRGVFGLHLKQRELTASGAEAYIPSTQSREQAVFYTGEMPIGPAARGMRLELGARAGRASLDPVSASGLPARSFSLGSGSVALRLPLGATVSTSLGMGVSERAPAIEELYAQGAHAATATWELGDPALGKERSRNLEWGLRGGEGSALRWNLGVFSQHFSNYIAAFGTDVNGDGVADRVDDAGQIANSVADPGAGALTQIAYRQARAHFRGIEADIQWRAFGSPWGVRVFGDAVRGSVDGLGAAPRQPPLRVGLSADYTGGPWAGFLSVMRAASQERTSVFETTTPGYTRVDAEISRQLVQSARGSASLFIQVRNLLDADIRLSTSFVKDSVPMPGRSIFAGLRVRM